MEVAHPVDDEAVESALDCNINNLHTALHHTHHTNSALPCPACACHLPSLILTFTYASLHAFNTCLAVELKMCSLAVWDHVSAVSPPAMMCLDLLSTTCYFSCTAAIQAERAPSSRHSCKSKAMQPVTDSHISGNQILADLVYKTECLLSKYSMSCTRTWGRGHLPGPRSRAEQSTCQQHAPCRRQLSLQR